MLEAAKVFFWEADEVVERESRPAPAHLLLPLGNCGPGNRQGLRESVRALPEHCSTAAQSVLFTSPLS